MADTRNLKYTQHKFGDHDLQRLGVWRWTKPPSTDPSSRTRYWLVYVHGGIWRDPRITHQQAQPTFSLLGGNSGKSGRLAGFASIDYRLSPHPDFPQDPATTPANELRAAKHPDHLADVRAALAFLRREFGVGDAPGETPYVLYGHSCGAALALQVVAALDAGPSSPSKQEVPLPAAVAGLEGCYDLVGLNARFGGAYRDLIGGAFGPDEEAWKAASPARFGGKFSETWGEGSQRTVLVVLAHSTQDKLVDMPELDAMEARLKREAPEGVQVIVRRDLKGDHNAVAESATTVVTVLLEAISALDGLEKLRGMAEEVMEEMFAERGMT